MTIVDILPPFSVLLCVLIAAFAMVHTMPGQQIAHARQAPARKRARKHAHKQVSHHRRKH